MKKRGAVVALGTAAVLSVGCSPSGDDGRTPVAVYAASSLTEAFADLELLFERVHPDIDAAITFAGSQVLRIQIEQGAPADVFASADPRHMRALTESGLVTASRVFATNELVVIVPLDNPAGIESFADLPRARRLVLGTVGVPAGRYARSMLEAADALVGSGFRDAVLSRVVSEEPNVRLARSKVELGEADAAIVYRTDAAASKDVRAIAIPPEINVRAEYVVGVVTREDGSPVAEAWISTLLSAEGRAVLEAHGFVVQ